MVHNRSIHKPISSSSSLDIRQGIKQDHGWVDKYFVDQFLQGKHQVAIDKHLEIIPKW